MQVKTWLSYLLHPTYHGRVVICPSKYMHARVLEKLDFPDYDFGKVFSLYRRVVKFVRNLNILLIKLYHQTPIQSTQSLKYRQLLISSTATLLAITIILGM